jgi:non-heme chloroperoxidase
MIMSVVRVGSQNGSGIDIYFEDHGSGPPVVLIHGYPLDGRSWERQERALLKAGYRVIAYDRRGFGQSSKPTIGYDYDTLAADLAVLIDHLGLTDINLVGFCMGTGEVARYLGTRGSARVRRAALLGALPPFLLKTDDNPEGVDGEVFDRIKAAIAGDRFAYLETFLIDSYNADVLGGSRISDQAWHAGFIAALGASAYATYACIDAWLTDFRPDLRRFDVPTLVIHGADDRILPLRATAERLPGFIKDIRVVTLDRGPHNIAWTYPDEVNAALLTFLAE